MFKKLLVITLSTIVLVGCGEEKEVTEDMLLGEWNCTNAVNKTAQYDDSGNKGAFKEMEVSNENLKVVKLKYVKEGNDLVMQTPYGSDIVDLHAKTDEDKWVSIQDKTQMRTKYDYVFVSNDEYKAVAQITIRYEESKLNKEEYYGETICKRISE